ncbi:siderophore-interacting protein [Agromyces mangrovi Wang et al. 2018]|uniref:siderophore-interacting protein n=1 Tax=Agromyces mangrovi TaxID=1858653 RepID=UPI0025742963|nr:siderophore-interacting protein [Agromyces mangrovi]BDZ64690.1 siderophore-interacting protein [Agromyces mangrovi]
MPTRLTVTGSTWVTLDVRRLYFHSDDLSAFAESRFTDRYVKLVFPKPGVPLPEPLHLRALRGTVPPEELPDVRTYTALFPDVTAGTLAIDFVIHGDEGVAGPWAAAAEPGDTLLVNGPGGAYAPDPDADWHLLVGDESAMPAIMAAIDVLPADAVARIVLLVDAADGEPALDLPAGATVTYVHRESSAATHDADGASEPDADASGGGPLLAAVRDLDWPDGRVQAFVHGEAGETMHSLRPYLMRERGLTRDQVSISGYWRRGRTEDGFRKWKAELAEAEGEPPRGGGRPGGGRPGGGRPGGPRVPVGN